MGLGALVAAYGLLLVPESLLGGGHVVAIGVTLLLPGLFSTEWARNRWNLSPTAQSGPVWGFLALGALLLVAFIVLDVVLFEGPFVESGSESGNRSEFSPTVSR